MNGNVAPPPTREEVLTVFRDDAYVFSAGEIAARIHLLRGGTEHPNDITPRERLTLSVRPLQPARVKQLLIEMVNEGLLMSREGYLAHDLGSVWGNIRPRGTYFALRESVEKNLAERAESQQIADKIRSLVAVLAESPDVRSRVRSVSAAGHEVVVTLSGEQACEMFGVPRDNWY